MADVDLDEFDLHEDDDFETIPCSFKYVRVCLLLPAVNGFLNAFLWPAYTLYFEEMGWPLVRAGLAVSVGFGSRVFMQQLQLRTGYWLIVPLSAVHLLIVVFALIFQTSEWAVFAQLVVWLGIDPTCAIEGIAFDSFGDSEAQARQATSTVLSVFTIAFACSCTFGGVLYDSAGWTGIALYHIILQGAMTLLLAVEPACRRSFRAVFFPGSEDEVLAAQKAENGVSAPEVFTHVVPRPSTEKKARTSDLPGVVEEMNVEDVLEEAEMAEVAEAAEVAEGEKKASLEPDQALSEGQNAAEFPAGEPVVDPSGGNHRTTAASVTFMANNRASNVSGPCETFKAKAKNRASVATRNTQMTEGRNTQMTRNTEVTVMTESQERNVQLLRRAEAVRRAQMAQMGRSSHVTGLTAVTGGSFGTFATFTSKASSDKKVTDRLRRAQIRGTILSKGTGGSGRTSRSKKTGRTALTALSQMTVLSSAGQHFRHHFACQAVLPEIIGARGGEGVLREEVDAVDENGSVVEASSTSKARIPKDVRLPAFFIVMNSFCNTCAYILEYATFAIFFKQVHNWNNATFAGLTQMAGDVLGAIVMQVIPFLMNNDYDPADLGCFRRYCHYLLSKPYTLSITLSTWVLFNLGMVSPSLPVAITAQVFMGTTFVYSCKWSTDMNLYYSLGDSQVFLSLQVLCRNADAIGGSIAGVLATWLFSIDPAAPFIFGTAMASLIFILYTLGFCVRLGFGQDIEKAEDTRSRRLGTTRVSAWKSDANGS